MVIAAIAVEPVYSGIVVRDEVAPDPVVPGTAGKAIVATTSVKFIVAISAADQVIGVDAANLATSNCIITTEPDDHVVAVGSVESIGSVGPDDCGGLAEAGWCRGSRSNSQWTAEQYCR